MLSHQELQARLKAFLQYAYDENGRVKPVSAAALKAISQVDEIEKYKGVIPDDSNLAALYLRKNCLNIIKSGGRLDAYTHDGILDDKVYELAATIELTEFPDGTTQDMEMFPCMYTFIDELRALEK